MPERINKLQPDRTLYLRGFDTFAAAASIHNASPTGFQISGVFRDPADFAVAVLYDIDNAFEHPSIRYLPDSNFAGLTLNFSLLYSDTVQPIDSPKYNWIDWATLDYVLGDGSSGKIPLFDNAMLAGTAFPAASATLAVVVNTVQLDERITLWYQNLAFDYTVPGGILGTAEYFVQPPGTSASISVDSTTYTYFISPSGPPQDGPTVAARLAQIADADPQVHFYASPGSNIITFVPKVNTKAVVNVSGYTMWLITDPVDAFIASTLASQIDNFNWVGANTTHGLLASISPASPNQITITAAQYGTVNTNNNLVSWVSGTKFSGVAPGTTFMIAGTAYQVASVESPLQLTLMAPAGVLTGVPYLAPRGGRDGNMITLYSLANSSNVTFNQSQVQLSGGSSAVTWNCSLDFTALSIDNLRQCWLTFAPSLANGAAYTASEWLATFSNWSLTGPASVAALQIAGPGSVRIEENYAACAFNQPWLSQAGPYSGYFAAKSQTLNDWVSITYTCQFTHNLYLGTSLDGTTASAAGLTLVTDSLYNNSFNGVPYSIYSDRGVAGITLDGDTETMLDCRFNTVGSELVARRLLRTSVAPGKHTVVIRVAEAGWIYFDFLQAAVLSDVPDPLTPRTNISPALDFDTDQTYKVSPSRLLWMLQKLGYGGPINEYLGVFWWNQRTPQAGTGSVSTAQVTFTGPFANGDLIILQFDPAGNTQLRKTVFPADTPDTIAGHFADFINGSLTGSWASTTTGGILTVTGRSPALPYNLTLTATVTSAHGSASVAYIGPPTGSYPTWDIEDIADTPSSPINRAVADWHADFYSQCHTLGLQVVTACSMELVNPPAGYAALYPDGTSVTTATDFGGLFSTQCAVGSSKMLAYQKAVYRQIAAMQSAAGLTPWVQYGEFLWWYFAGASGMGYYDAETVAAAAASTGLGRALHTFLTPNDDPNAVNGGADAVFLRDRLRDYVAALVADIRSAYPAVACEVLWPYDVNYPTPLSTGGGQLNRFVNLPVEWQTKPSSGLDRMKVEALAFATSLRNLNLAREAAGLFSSFGWPLDSLTYLVPVFGSATPWIRELSLARAAGISITNLWALDHVCLYNLSVPERPLERRSVAKK